MSEQGVRIGVIGGSGVYRLFPGGQGEERVIETPFGIPVTVTVGEIGGRQVAFLPRHGADHSVPPHRLDARPVAWALASLGVHAIISTAAVGSLTPDIPVGSLVLADQLVDRTYGRPQTFFDADLVRHLPFSDPFCPALHEIALGIVTDVVSTASVLVIQGPRFSTRAESRMNRAAGIDLVNMTLMPEVALAAELGMGTVTLCVVTDVDSGEHAEDAVTAEAVFARLSAAEPHILAAIASIAAAIPEDYPGRQLIDADAVASVLAWPAVSKGVDA